MMGDVFEIDAQLVGHEDLDVVFVGVGCLCQQLVLVAVAYRRHIGDARTHVQDVQLLRRVHIDVFPYLGARSHETHVADEDVDQLRQFVELVFAYEVPRPCNTRVVSAYRNQSLPVCSHTHRAELVQPEIPIVASHPCLPVKDGACGVEFYPDGKQQKQRTQHKQAATACHHIEKTFQKNSVMDGKGDRRNS